jgi:hypothetical protein
MSEPITLTIAKFTGSLSNRGGVNVGANDVSVLDIRELQRRMRDAGPNFRAEFMRDVKKIGKPLESEIKSTIRNIEPLSGFRKDRGRLGWGVGVAPDKTLVQFKTSMGGRSLTTTLLRIKIFSPAVIILDMAGRTGKSVGEGRRNDNSPPTTRRRNANRNKGNAFIASLNREIGDGSASRFIYPAAEDSLPALSQDVQKVLDDAMRRFNMRGI